MPKFTYTGLAAAAAAVLLALSAAGPALAAAPRTANTLTVGSTTGPNVAVGDNLTAALPGSSTLSTSAGNITWTAGSFAATDLTDKVFGSVSVSRQSGSSSLCPSSGKFSATYKPVLDVTRSNGTVYVN